MRILNCHIENFGKLHDDTVDFTGNKTILCKENGWGKSTFAAFIRAMFYGLSGERKQSIGENERKRYRPWQGGVFGGRMTIEVEGKEYVVSRIFGSKEAEDEFELRDAQTNLISHDYSERLGEELFQINRESFLRTVFMEQSGCKTKTTDDIHAKIGNLTEAANDLNSFEAAAGRLTDILNKLNPRKVTGTLSKLAAEVTALEREVRDGQELTETLDKYQDYLQAESERYARLGQQFTELGGQQSRISGLQALYAKKEEWDRLCAAKEERQKEFKSAGAGFPGEIPEEDELEQRLREVHHLAGLMERKKLYQLSASEEAELAGLREQFAGGISDTDAVLARWNMRNTKQAVLASNQAALAALKATMDMNRKAKISSLAVLGAVCLLFGTGFFVVSLVPDLLAATAGLVLAVGGLSLALIGIILTVFGLINGKKEKAKAQEVPAGFLELQESVEQDRNFIENTDKETAVYLLQHGIRTDADNYLSFLQSLKEREGRCRLLSDKLENYQREQEEYNRNKEKICAFLSSYGYTPQADLYQQLTRLQKDAAAYRSAGTAYAQAKKACEAFEASAGFADAERALQTLPEESLPSLEDISQQILKVSEEKEQSQKRINEYVRTLEEYRERYEEWFGKREQLAERQEKLAAERRRYGYVVQAKEYLTKAKEAMTLRYSAPVYERFREYYEMLTGASAENLKMDANINITVEEQGKQREVDTLSTGYQDLIGICLRIALVDVMYQNEAPVLILDDPFVNLDDAKTAAAKRLLDAVAAKYQVVYLTCSRGRSFVEAF